MLKPKPMKGSGSGNPDPWVLKFVGELLLIWLYIFT